MSEILRRQEETDESGKVWLTTIVRCDCDRIVECASSWANECLCGAEYNGFGQKLAPRECWGEETGENFTTGEDL